MGPDHDPLALLEVVGHAVDAAELDLVAMDVTYPVAIDSDYAIWNGFANRYWPAVYIADARGEVRHRDGAPVPGVEAYVFTFG
jgi:hypothetical protein